MDSIIDIKVLRDKNKLTNAGKLIARAVAKHLKLKIKEGEQIVDKPQTVSEWAKNAQKFVIDKGISDGTRPKSNVTREEVWVMLERLYNK